MPKLKRTLAQNNAIHKLLGDFGFDRESKAEMVADITNGRAESTKEMYFDEANVMITRLGGRAFNRSFKSRRTENYHRQQAGVKAIVTQAHLAKLQRLADGRGMGNAGVVSMCRRMLKDEQGNPLDQPRTTADCNKIIEAIKAMNARDAKATNPQSKIRNPKSRRAA